MRYPRARSYHSLYKVTRMFASTNILKEINAALAVLESDIDTNGAAITAISEACVFISRCSIWQDTVQAILNETYTKIKFDTILYDNNNECDVSVEHCFTAKADGYYSINAQVVLDNLNADRLFRVIVRKNGNNVVYGHNHVPTNSDCVVNVNKDLYLETGDYIEVFVWHNHTSTQNTLHTQDTTFLTIHRFK